MAYESIKVDIIPGAENAEVLHFSQYDNKRPFFIELFNGGAKFIPEAGMSLSLECRKRDGNIVIISDYTLTDNVAEFSTTEQLTACYGDNMAEIKIVDDNDLVIGSANFIINVEKSPTCGGLTSESEIDNLTQQIEDITQQVIGDDYYTKVQTDALLENKADKSELPDMTNYYTKAQTDDLLDRKVDYDELNQYYKKTEVDNLLNAKVDKTTLQEDYYDADYINTQFARKSFVENYVDATAKASGNPCTFDTAKYHTIIPALTADIVCGGGGGTPSTPIPLVGHSELNLTRCGINVWDEQWDVGTYQLNTINSKNPIYVVAGKTYYFHCVDGGTIYEFTSNGTNTKSTVLFTSGTITMRSDTSYVKFYINASYGTTYNNDVSLNSNADFTDYAPYTPTLYTVAFGQTVYGGVYDKSGSLKPCVYYPSYNGETLSGRWKSSEAVYAEGTIPPIGSEVVSLDDYGTPFDVPSISVFAENGVNNIVSDCGGDVNVSYKDTIQHYIDSRL